MASGYFITGTDTEVGKTWCTLGLISAIQQRGQSVAAMKPVASGCVNTAEGLRNDDALRLQAQASVAIPYEWVNPYAFAPAIAPHLAAAQSGITIEIDTIVDTLQRLRREAEITVIEGVGGWQVPLNDQESVADLAHALGLPVILVVGLRLGCINHALLTAESIRTSGCTLAGWIANSVDPQMSQQTENISAIEQRIRAPLLGVVPYMQGLEPEKIASYLNAMVFNKRPYP